MKKIVKIISKLFIYIISFSFTLFVFFMFGTFIYSQKNNTHVTNTLIEFQTIGKEFIDFNFTNKSDINLNSSDTKPSKQNTEIKVSTTASSPSNYYYKNLDNTSKIIYDSLKKNINNLKKEKYIIDFSDTFNDLLHEPSGEYKINKAFQSALDAFFYDHPELFYIDLTKLSLNITCVSIGPIEKYTVKLVPSDNKNYYNKYFSSETEVLAAIKEVENIKNNFINKYKDCNDYEKIVNIHDALADSLEYDSSLSKENIYNIYGALINQEVVCEGYAKAFKYILDSFNIECILVSGNATNSSGDTESHMWNYVKLNGAWYGVDVTWDDPIIVGGSSKNNVRHDYLLKGYYTFLRTHTPNKKISDTGMSFKLPTLSSSNYK